MSETGVAYYIASISATLLALFGVDYYSLFWATAGSVAALLYAAPSSRMRALFGVAIASFLGAALGTFFAGQMHGDRSVLIVCSIVCASAPQVLINAILNRLVREINRGSKEEEALKALEKIGSKAKDLITGKKSKEGEKEEEVKEDDRKRR